MFSILIVMIAIDGLRPADLTSAATAAWRVPVLRGLMRKGASAAGVRGVLPTITLPSLATLVTGTSPGTHGVVTNVRCDAGTRADGGYYWYARDVRVETLWEAAQKNGLKTANVGWTSTVDGHIELNLPELWSVEPGAQYALQSSHSTPGLVAQLDPEASRDARSYRMDDDRRTRYVETLIDSYHPDFLTVFYENLDNTEHRTGVGTPEDRRALEHIDSLVGEVVSAARRQSPNVTVVIVSDHGFANSTTDINLSRAFADAGSSARACSAGGTAFVLHADAIGAALLRHPNPEYGIERVLDRQAIAKLGGWRDADYAVVFRPGYVAARDSSAPLRAPSQYRGMHGYWPDDPAMYATFIIDGPNVPRKRHLGLVDMRDIAPTIAKLLGAHLDGASGKALF